MDYDKHKEEVVRATQLWECGDITRENLEYIFPELRESEDEKIKKYIIKHFQEHLKTVREFSSKGTVAPFSSEEIKMLEASVAWLEKQGEQKPADEVEPKFRIGDWIVDEQNKELFYVNKILSKFYEIVDIEGDKYHIPHHIISEYYRLWSIADAKDGDVLVDEDNNIGIYHEEKADSDWESYTYLGCDNYLHGGSIGGYHNSRNTHPATKEQSELLFQKMIEAGYEWNGDTHTLTKIS